MAIGVTARSGFASTTDGSTYVSGSFTPTAKELLVATYQTYRANAQPTNPTVTGHDGGTVWTQIATIYFETTAGTRRSMWLFGCVTGASPSPGSVTFDHSGVTHTGATGGVFEVSGADEETGLVQTFVQSALGPVNGTSLNNLTITLAPSSAPGNRAFACFVKSNTDDTIARANWAEIHDVNHVTPAQSLQNQWRADVFEATTSASWTNASPDRCGISWEIKAAVTATPGGGGVSQYSPEYMRRLRRRQYAEQDDDLVLGILLGVLGR